jgi:hypothetical protein
VLATLAACLFALSAALQWNDPDPLRWLLLYLGAALVCGLHALGRGHRGACLALAALAVAWAAALAPRVIARADLGGSEEERELAGLLLVAGVCASLARRPAPE